MASAAALQHDLPEEFSTGENFADLLDEVLGEDDKLEGQVLRGQVTDVRNDHALVDVGLKSEGMVPLKEFGKNIPDVGDEVDVFVDRFEDREGQIVLSREKARREESWVDLEKAYIDNLPAQGAICGRVKGGYVVDLNGAVAFLPNSQVDVRPIRDVTALLNVEQPFQILKMDRKRGNIVVSRRAILEESQAEARSDFVNNLEEGQTLQGVVKNITDYGAFIDLGGMDGLLHVTDIAWRRINHPSEVLQLGQTIDVKVTKFNQETQRISLGMKQLEEDPWSKVSEQYPEGSKTEGEVVNVTEYGAFVELEPGIEGLVHVSEMSWNRRDNEPAKLVSTSQKVNVMVLEIDHDKRRISLGMKQCQDNPFEAFTEKQPIGSSMDATIANTNNDGLIIDLGEGLEGFVSSDDIDWNETGIKAIRQYKAGDMVTVKVIDINPSKDRVTLGIKQLQDDPFMLLPGKGKVVTCTVSKVQDNGVEVHVNGDNSLIAFMRRSDLSRDRSEQRPDRFAVGEKVDAMITNIDLASRKISLSIKARELAEERQAMEQFGSTDSGASLGDILGAALGGSGDDEKADADDKKDD